MQLQHASVSLHACNAAGFSNKNARKRTQLRLQWARAAAACAPGAMQAQCVRFCAKMPTLTTRALDSLAGASDNAMARLRWRPVTASAAVRQGSRHPQRGGAHVRAEAEEVRARLDGREALPRHEHRARALKALDRAAHRSLQLEDGRRGRVARVDRLLVLDQRQRQHAVVRGHRGLERVEVDPEVVGVEELVLVDVFECGLVIARDHRALAQHQLACMRSNVAQFQTNDVNVLLRSMSLPALARMP